MPNTCKSNELWQFIVRVSGKRVSNTWTIFPRAGDNSGKPELIPRETTSWHQDEVKAPQGALEEGFTAYQLVGGVKAHQGDDG
jgi:hypothetical protein